MAFLRSLAHAGGMVEQTLCSSCRQVTAVRRGSTPHGRAGSRAAAVAALLALSTPVASVRAQTPGEPAAEETRPAAPQPPPFTLGGYVEAFYQWNFGRPSGDITNYRGFDNRHDTFTLANVALDLAWDYRNVIGRITAQVGHTPSTYYMAEPQRPGSSGANASGSELWKYLQQAYAGYRFIDALSVTVGLFLSPIGPESMAVHDNWNWSHSNLFFGLPFYHTGARATYVWRHAWSFALAAYNGWNSVVDNNGRKSVSTQVAFTSAELTASLLYFGGAERPGGAPEGTPWRNLFDGHATWHALRWLSLIAHGNAGFEHNALGRARWLAGALFARARLVEGLYFAARGDVFRERAPRAAGAIFWPVPWVSSATATLEYRPAEHVSFRAEYRHDQAGGALYFGGRAPRAADSDTFLPDRKAQDTLTFGVTAWL